MMHPMDEDELHHAEGRRPALVLHIPTDDHSVSADSVPDAPESDPTTDAALASRRWRWCAPMSIAYIAVGICAVVGAVFGVVITVQYNSADGPTTNQQTSGGDNQVSPPTPFPATTLPPTQTTKQENPLRLFAVGGWGAAPNFAAHLGSATNVYRDDQDRAAQAAVASLMASHAATNPPKLIITQGNNFNWYGLVAQANLSIDMRVAASFSATYNQSSLAGIRWAAVMGQNDYGGGHFLCGGGTEETLHACGNGDALLKGLRRKFHLQQRARDKATVKAGKQHRANEPDNATIADPRWTLKDHYYKQTVQTADAAISIDIFHVDVAVHAARTICCQCIGYAAPADRVRVCPTIRAQDDYCAGGNLAFYKACRRELQSYSDDALARFRADAAASTATFKIVNAHMSPLDMPMAERTAWLQILRSTKVHLWLHGHDPTVNHAHVVFKKSSHHAADDTVSTHFMANGIGGGVPVQLPPPNTTSHPLLFTLSDRAYGFVEIAVNATTMRMQVHTTDNRTASYCYEIPQSRRPGRVCG
ncbi:Aste57867_25474 [Aphanomyces stellatus]|uniref:Aste57867_25474 protein n=1 Tax=Aphanomyces stellatus TaxID=120398 RepID=A0A485LVP0_9STRA|nr:hypothetical protein As57867_025395 [Aphanomyces stellatus]VFU02097.1 Aste57867_25474 [Aphanomyces stellatus]